MRKTPPNMMLRILSSTLYYRVFSDHAQVNANGSLQSPSKNNPCTIKSDRSHFGISQSVCGLFCFYKILLNGLTDNRPYGRSLISEHPLGNPRKLKFFYEQCSCSDGFLVFKPYLAETSVHSAYCCPVEASKTFSAPCCATVCSA